MGDPIGVTHVLVVDDDAMVRSGIEMLVSAHPDLEVAGAVADGLHAVAAARELRPDVVLMDLSMPGLDGVQATRAIIDDSALDGATPRVLALTTFGDDETVLAVLHAGASGFIVKDSAPLHLPAAIRTIAAGRGWLDPTVTTPVIDALRRANPPDRATLGERLAGLTERELEILTLLADGLSNAEIARGLFVSEATVRTHVSRILMKTDSRDRTQAVVLAFRCGLVPSAPGGARSTKETP